MDAGVKLSTTLVQALVKHHVVDQHYPSVRNAKYPRHCAHGGTLLHLAVSQGNLTLTSYLLKVRAGAGRAT